MTNVLDATVRLRARRLALGRARLIMAVHLGWLVLMVASPWLVPYPWAIVAAGFVAWLNWRYRNRKTGEWRCPFTLKEYAYRRLAGYRGKSLSLLGRVLAFGPRLAGRDWYPADDTVQAFMFVTLALIIVAGMLVQGVDMSGCASWWRCW